VPCGLFILLVGTHEKDYLGKTVSFQNLVLITICVNLTLTSKDLDPNLLIKGEYKIKPDIVLKYGAPSALHMRT
jgi:hypothetical protein